MNRSFSQPSEGRSGRESPPRQGVRLLLTSSGVAQVCALGRYVLLARLLGPEQLGLAATLILVGQFFDSISDVGGDRFLIQYPDGDREDVQRLVQLLMVGRGVVNALLLAALAWPIARLFDAPVLATGLALLAIPQLLVAFTHLDLRRAQRHGDFRTDAWATTVGEVLSVVGTVLGLWLVRDFTAVLWGAVARACGMVLVSHLRAERPFRLGLAPGHTRALSLFSAPLILNGALMFFGSQSDRVLIGDSVGIAALGLYSAILLLVMYPMSMVQRFLSSTYLPQIAAARAGGGGVAAISRRMAATTTALAIAMMLGFVLVAPMAVPLLYGPAFRYELPLVALVGCLQAIRFVRHWPSTDALAHGRSDLVLVTNFVRLVGIPLALLADAAGGEIEAIVAAFAAGEALAMLVGVVLTNRAVGRAWTASSDLFATLALIIGLAFGAAVAAQRAEWGMLATSLSVMAALLTRVAWRERKLVEEWHGTLARIVRSRGRRSG